MIFITGDIHSELSDRLDLFEDYLESHSLEFDNNYLIICGDFGCIWNYLTESDDEKYELDNAELKPYTILFVDGNHENFSRLNNDYEVIDWNGGKVHKIRNNIFHLMRGEIFNIEGKTFFAFGGAKSHDIKDGIVPDTPRWETEAMLWYYENKQFRIENHSWWKEELPSEDEISNALKNLSEHNFEVDYVISHCITKEIAALMRFRENDILTEFFNSLIKQGLKFKQWYFGHYHCNKFIQNTYICSYSQIIQLC